MKKHLARRALTSWLVIAAGSFQPAGAIDIEHAVELHLPPNHFGPLSASLTAELRRHPPTAQISSVTSRMLGILGLQFRDISLHALTDEIHITPGQQSLQLESSFHRVQLSVGQASFASSWFPVIGLSCQRFQIEIGQGRGFTLRGKLNATVHQQRLHLKPQIDLDIPQNPYGSQGPATCHGPDGVPSPFGKIFAAVALALVRPAVRPLLHRAAESATQQLETWLNDPVSMEQTLNIPSFILTPQIRLRLKLALDQLHIDPQDGLRVSFHATIGGERPDPRTDWPHPSASSSPASPFSPSPARITTPPYEMPLQVTLATQLLNQALHLIYSHPQDALELSPAFYIKFEEILHTHHLQDIWPELSNLNLGAPYLRAFAHVVEPPHLRSDSRNPRQLHLEAPYLRLDVDVHDRSGWRPFFQLDVALGVRIRVDSLARRQWTLHLTEMTTRLSGDWHPDYTPSDPHFAQSALESLIQTLTDSFTDSERPRIFSPPQLAIGPLGLELAEINTSDEKLVFSLALVPPPALADGRNPPEDPPSPPAHEPSSDPVPT